MALTAPVLEQTYRYAFPSSLVVDGDRRRLRLATSGGPALHPRFFRGRLLVPVVAADLLLTLGDVARSRFHVPAQMLKRILELADPVATCADDRLRFEAFSACCSVYGRVDLLPEAFDGEILGRGTTNVDFGPGIRTALAGVQERSELGLSIGASELEVRTGGGSAVSSWPARACRPHRRAERRWTPSRAWAARRDVSPVRSWPVAEPGAYPEVIPAQRMLRLPVSASIAVSLLLIGCGAVSERVAPSVPTGLDPSHVLFAIDYIVHHPALDGVYDPRSVTLTADGTLVLERRDVDAIMGATATKLDAAGLERAWSTIVSSGVFTDGLLDLPGFASQTVTTATDVFRVDDGTRSSILTIDDLGSEQIYAGDPPIGAAEMKLRASATQLIEDLGSMGDREPWTPPAILMWWRSELPADWNATVVPWPVAIDLATAGDAIDHPIWTRCVRLEGDQAAEVARLARSLPIDHLVEQGGGRYGLVLRPIHEDEIDDVDCP